MLLSNASILPFCCAKSFFFMYCSFCWVVTVCLPDLGPASSNLCKVHSTAPFETCLHLAPDSFSEVCRHFDTRHGKQGCHVLYPHLNRKSKEVHVEVTHNNAHTSSLRLLARPLEDGFILLTPTVLPRQKSRMLMKPLLWKPLQAGTFLFDSECPKVRYFNLF